MPHDRKGRLIEIGDHLKFKSYGAEAFSVGRVFSVSPGSETCNVSVVHLQPSYWPIAQACVTARETELVLKNDGSEPFEPPAPSVEAGRARVGVLAILAALVALALPMVAHADSPEPACGTVLAPKACVSFTTGAVSVVTRGERREYLTMGGSIEALLPWGLSTFANVDAFGVQDGGSLDYSSPQSYRAVKLEAGRVQRAGWCHVLDRGKSGRADRPARVRCADRGGATPGRRWPSRPTWWARRCRRRLGSRRRRRGPRSGRARPCGALPATAREGVWPHALGRHRRRPRSGEVVPPQVLAAWGFGSGSSAVRRTVSRGGT
jgi:hypothetical protein